MVAVQQQFGQDTARLVAITLIIKYLSKVLVLRDCADC